MAISISQHYSSDLSNKLKKEWRSMKQRNRSLQPSDESKLTKREGYQDHNAEDNDHKLK